MGFNYDNDLSVIKIDRSSEIDFLAFTESMRWNSELKIAYLK